MISIVVPVYNVEAYLAACLDSVLRQSFADFEIVLVNDGATDSSPAICEAYAQRDSRIRLIHQENRGLSGARNTGIDHARGEYLLFLDSDDLLPDDALQLLHAAAREHHADFTAGTFLRLFEDGSMRPARLRDPIHGVETYTGFDKMDNYIRVPKQSNSVAGKLFARELFDGIRFPEGKLFEDIYVTYQLVHRAECIALCEKPSYIYRRRGDSIMLRPCSRRDFDAVEGRLAEEDFVLRHYPTLAHHTHVRVFSTVFALIVRSARGGLGDKGLEKRMQILVRRYLKNYLKCRASRKKKLVAMLAWLHIDLARFMVRVYAKGLNEEGV